MTTLPRFMVLTCNIFTIPRFATYTEGAREPLPGLHKFDELNVLSPKVKLAVEPSASGNGRMVHIRSCYNNKYWVSHRFSSHLGTYVAALSDKPEEDQSKETCTLFEYIFSGDNRIQLRHAQNKMFVSYDTHFIDAGVRLFGTSVPAISHSYYNFSYIDWETLVILPSRVSFRSEDLDGKYLCSRVIQRYNYQMFDSGVDVGNPQVAKELFPTNNGNYRIKDGQFGRFWRRSPNWIWADAEDSNTSDDTMFTIVKISDNVVALRNLGNNRFVGALTLDGKTDCLNAQYPNLSREVRLIVEELVVSRDIYGITYRLSDARVYREEIIEVDSSTGTNNFPDRDDISTLSFTVTDNRVRNWNSSLSLTLGVRTEFQVGWIPFIASGTLELSASFETSYEWGETSTFETSRAATYQVTIPPMSSTRVTLMATRAMCDVPFSYTQRDLLTDGQFVTTVKDDGIYTGINSYNFYYESTPVTAGERVIIYK